MKPKKNRESRRPLKFRMLAIVMAMLMILNFDGISVLAQEAAANPSQAPEASEAAVLGESEAADAPAEDAAQPMENAEPEAESVQEPQAEETVGDTAGANDASAENPEEHPEESASGEEIGGSEEVPEEEPVEPGAEEKPETGGEDTEGVIDNDPGEEPEDTAAEPIDENGVPSDSETDAEEQPDDSEKDKEETEEEELPTEFLFENDAMIVKAVISDANTLPAGAVLKVDGIEDSAVGEQLNAWFLHNSEEDLSVKEELLGYHSYNVYFQAGEEKAALNGAAAEITISYKNGLQLGSALAEEQQDSDTMPSVESTSTEIALYDLDTAVKSEAAISAENTLVSELRFTMADMGRIALAAKKVTHLIGPKKFLWEDSGKIVTVTLSNPAALPVGAEFVVEDLTKEEYDAYKNVIIQQRFLSDEGAGETEEERVAYAEQVMKGLVLYDMHFVYKNEEIEPTGGEISVNIENKVPVQPDTETVSEEENCVFVKNEEEEESYTAIHIKETPEGEQVVDVTDHIETNNDGAVESVALTTDSFSVIGYYPMTEWSKVPITDETFGDFGGSYSLYYILNNFNVFTRGDATCGHTIGAVAVGGTPSFRMGIGRSGYEHTTPSYFANKFAENGFNSYLGGNVIFIKEFDSNIHSWAYGSYDIRINEGKNNAPYINFETAFSSIISETNAYANSSMNIKVDLGQTSDYYSYDGSTVTVKAGYGYEFSNFDNINGINVEISDGDNYGNVNLVCKAQGTVYTPQVYFNGSPELPGMNSDKEVGSGCGAVFLLPNASVVDDSKAGQRHIGHVVAPNATVVNVNGDANGCWVADSVNIPGTESHMWPYNGNIIAPVSHGFQATKTVDGKVPEEGQNFTFCLDELTNGTWTEIQKKENASGSIVFDEISYSDDSAVGDHWYRIYEMPEDNDAYEYSTAKYLIKVIVTKSVEGDTTTYSKEASYYKVNDGVSDEELLSGGIIDTNKITGLTAGESKGMSELLVFNNTSIKKGKLKIKKSVTVNDESTTGNQADGTYTFVIRSMKNGAVAATKEITISNGAANELLVEDLAPGVYIVSEDISKNPLGMSLVGKNDIQITVSADQTAEIPTASFTNNLVEVGSLRIKKNVTVNGKPTTGKEADGTYSFVIRDENGIEKDMERIRITDGKSETVQVDNLKPGVYRVYEFISANPYGMNLVGKNEIEVVVTANNTADIPTAEFTNNRVLTGRLKITKHVTVNGEKTTGTEADGKYAFRVFDSNGTEKAYRSITIKNGQSTTVEVDNLEPGYYTVAEAVADNPAGMTLVGKNEIEVEVKGDNEADIPTVEFTNNKTSVGSLKITKHVTVNGEATTETEADGTYTFRVYDSNGDAKAYRALTIRNGKSTTVQIDNLEPGIYKVAEVLTGNPKGMTLVGQNEIEVEVKGDNTADIPTVEFTNNKTVVGSLKITKNVTVNGESTTGTEADGTYTFRVYDSKDVEKAVRTLTIRNGKSATVQIDNLEPGIYKVAEVLTDNPAGMTLVGQNGIEVEVKGDNTADIPTVEFTNNKTVVGSLKITKNVTVNGEATTGTEADGTYTFRVYDSKDVEKAVRTLTIRNGKSATVQIDNLEPGIYKVAEIISDNPSGMALVGKNDIEVEVKGDNEADIPTVEFTNNKTVVGSLKITKNVTVNGEATTGTEADGTYTFRVYDSKDVEKAVRTLTIRNGKSATVQIDNLEPGIYKVAEIISDNPSGMALVGKNDIEVEVKGDNEADIPTVEFTNNKTVVGSLKITKNVTVNGEATTGTEADGTYTFRVYDSKDVEKAVRTLTIRNGKSATVQIDNLEPGIYKVAEVLTDNPEGMTLVGQNGIEIEVKGDNEADIPTVEFTNNKTVVGSLKITKNVTVNGEATTGTEADGTYTFRVYDSKDVEKAVRTLTIRNGKSATVQIDNLEPGIYKVAEVLTDNPAGMTLVGQNGIEVEVKGDNEADIPTVEFTNNKTVVGSLKITKNVTVNGEATTGTEADGTYTFRVYNSKDVEKAVRTLTIRNGKSATVQIDNLEPGIYKVAEVLTDNPAGMTLVGQNGIEVEVKGDNEADIPTVEFTNNKTVVGSLKITKNVTVNGEATTGTEADGTYTFRVYNSKDVEKAVRTLTVRNGKSATVQVDNLEPGIYKVAEVLTDNPAGMTLVGQNGIEVEVKGDNEADIPTVEFTNNKTVVGSLKITKNVTVNGEATTGTEADGTYTFRVYDSKDVEKAVRTLTIRNGKSAAVQIDNLEPGIYKVAEVISDNPSGMALVGKNDIEVEVKGDNTADIPTVEFTNNKTVVGSLKITKNVTINGESTTGTEADGTYTFRVYDSKDVEKAVRTLTIRNGKSATVQIDNLEPGIYKVAEVLTDNPAGMTLVGQNGIEVEVKGDNEADIPTVEFTNNKTAVGSLKITKNVTVMGEKTSGTEMDGTYIFRVYDVDGKEKAKREITIRNGESSTAAIENLLPGAYIVTEDTSILPSDVRLIGENSITVQVEANNMEKIPTAVFTNDKYQLEGEIALTAEKVLEGSALEEGQFSFRITETDAEGKAKENGLQAQAENNADGTIAFPVIQYTEEGTYYYQISEAADSKPGYEYDQSVYTVEVTAKDDSEGKLITAIAAIYKDGEKLEENPAVVFHNKYTAEGTTILNAVKSMASEETELGTFTFELADENGNILETVENDKAGSITFAALSYDGEDAGKTYTYTVSEKIPESKDAYIYDRTIYTVTVKVTDNGDGTLEIETKVGDQAYEDGLIQFVNDVTEVQFSKIDAETKEPLAGAALQIQDKDGHVIEEWESDGSIHAIKGILKAGETYTLVETKAPENYVIAEPITFTVSKEESVMSVVMEDARKENENASLLVTKTLTFEEEPIYAIDETFYVALYADEECAERVSEVKPIVFKNASSSTVEFQGLQVGKTYYVGESDEEGNVILSGVVTSGDMFIANFKEGQQFEVTEADGTITCYFENEFVTFPDGFYKEGKLTITKKLLDADGNEKNSDKKFYAGIFEDSSYTTLSDKVSANVVELDMNGGSSTSQTVTVAVGNGDEEIVLYVTEVDEDGIPVEDSDDFIYILSQDKTSVVITQEESTASVVLTNKEKTTVTPTPIITSTPAPTEAPKNTTTSSGVKTGDDTPIALYLVLLAAACILIGIVGFKKRRKEK